MNRVVVTGMGLVSPIGNSLNESWISAKAGLSGISPIKRFDTSNLKWVVGGELKGFEPDRYLSQKELTRLDSFLHYSVSAATTPVADPVLIRHSSITGEAF